MNPVDYAMASIIGLGCVMKRSRLFFAKMIHRKTKAQETGTTFPLSPENLSAVMKTQFTNIFLN